MLWSRWVSADRASTSEKHGPPSIAVPEIKRGSTL